VKKSEIFTTAADMQTSVTIHIFQGERPMAPDNASLGEFNLDGLAPAPRGMPKIEVTFDIDSNGILNVNAKDTATGKSQSIRITGSTRLSDADKQRMIHEAEQYADQDKKRREEVDKLNAADSASYQAERMLADFGDKLTAELKGRIEAALREVKEALARRDAQLATERAETLQKVLKEAGAVIYSQTPGAGVYAQTPYPREKTEEGASAGEARPSGSGPRGRVVDAEYKEAR
jgi:molecular chaperone DnaK